MHQKKQKRHYMQPIRNAANLSITNSGWNSPNKSLTTKSNAPLSPKYNDLSDFDLKEQIEDEKFRLIQAKKIKDMIESQYYNQIKSKQKQFEEEQRIKKFKKEREIERKKKAELRRLHIIEDAKRRLQIQEKKDIAIKEKNAASQGDIMKKIEAARQKKEEERVKLAERAQRESDRRKRMKAQRRERVQKEMKRRMDLKIQRYKKAEKRHKIVQEKKEIEKKKLSEKMMKKRIQQQQKVSCMKKFVEKELKLKRARSEATLKKAAKKRKELELKKEIELQQRKVQHEMKRIKVLEKKQQLIIKENSETRAKVEEKEKVIKERIAELQSKDRERSHKIHKEITAKLQRAKENVVANEQEEVEYINGLRSFVDNKMQRISVFKKQKHILHKKQMENKLKHSLKRQKFRSLIDDILRYNNSISKLTRMGINISNPENIDLQELVEVLSTISDNEDPNNAGTKHELVFPTKSNKKYMVASKSNVSFTLPQYKPRNDPIMKRTLNMRGENQYTSSFTAVLPTTPSRNIGAGMRI